MTRVNRRGFLRGAAAAAFAAGQLPRGLQAALAIGPGGSSLAAVKHVVVFMQENRSFDHYFGTLSGVRGFGDPTALTLRNGNTVFAQPRTFGSVLPFHLDTATTSAQCVQDLDHSWPGTHLAWNRGRYDGWARTKTSLCMGHYTRADIPFHFALADAFTVCDQYFCSVMGPTNPNRFYLMSGTIDPRGLAGGPATSNRTPGFSWATYPERLQAAGVSWKVYQNTADNYDDNALAHFTQYRNARPGNPLHDLGMSSVPSVSGDTVTDIVSAIRQDVLNGTLPQVAWIVGPESASEHPACSPAAGADMINQVLEALTADPEVWASTVLFLNYDENDGYFDHVSPPVPPRGTADEFVAGAPIGLGPRVPMLVLSPWSRGGYVCSQVFDHTSVLRFLETWTGVSEPNISAWRRKICGDLTATLDFTRTSLALPPLPDTGPLLDAANLQCSTLPRPRPPAAQCMPVPEDYEPRPARALPWQPNANARLDNANGKLCLNMDNAATAATSLALHFNDYHSAAPRVYDVDASAPVIDSVDVRDVSDGRYDVSLYGPNGFLRRFAGDANTGSASIDVLSSYDISCLNGSSFNCSRANCSRVDSSSVDPSAPTGISLQLTLANRGVQTVVFTVSHNAYRDDAPSQQSLSGGETRIITIEVEQSTHGWYDLSITVDCDGLFHRRLAGHIELGRESISGSAAPLANGTLKTLTPSVKRGAIIRFDYRPPVDRINASNWVALYRDDQTPGEAEPIQWLGAGNAHGSALFTTLALRPGHYCAWLLHNRSHVAIAPPAKFSVLPFTRP